MYYQIGGFIDDKNIVVFVENSKLDLLRLIVNNLNMWNIYGNSVIGYYLLFRFAAF